RPRLLREGRRPFASWPRCSSCGPPLACGVTIQKQRSRGQIERDRRHTLAADVRGPREPGELNFYPPIWTDRIAVAVDFAGIQAKKHVAVVAESFAPPDVAGLIFLHRRHDPDIEPLGDPRQRPADFVVES